MFTLLIALAVCVQLARQAFPLVQDYQQNITDYFGHKLGMVIEVEFIDASWKGLRPKLTLKKVVVKSRGGDPVFTIDELTAELSLVSSLWNRRLSWRQLKFDGFDTRLVQSETIGWAIPGMPSFSKTTVPPSDAKTRASMDPYDVFLLGRRITITDASFVLQYFSGETTEINIPEISIENDRDFHRIKASLDIAETEAFSLVIEGHGDPREQDFVADGYLELNKFPTQNVINALALSDNIHVSDEHRVDLKLWFTSDANKGATLYGELSAEGELSLPKRKLRLPNYVSTRLFGNTFQDDTHQENAWQLTLGSLQAKWGEMSSPALDLALYGNARKFKGIKVNQLEVKPWVDIVLAMDLDHARAEAAIASLAPSGTLKYLDVKLTNKEAGYFLATAKVEKGSSQAFMDAPAFKNINGYVSSSLFAGSIDVLVKDGFTIDLPKVYHEPLFFTEAQGHIAWNIDIDKHVTHLSSGLITVKNPEEEGRGYLHLSMPFAKKYGEPKMTLAIGIKNTLAKNHKKYVPKTIPKHLYKWLGTSIKQGRVAGAKFLYHGSLGKNAEVSPSIQLHGEVHDGNLVFDPQWPELNGVSGHLMLDNANLDVHVDRASLLGNSVFDAAVSLVADSTGKGLALSIEGSLASDAKAAMTLLKSSPIKKYIGSTFDKWDFSGGVAAKVELIIPLSSESADLSHLIEVTFANAQIEMPDLGLNIQNIAGKLFYQTEKGIYADKLTGNIWGRPFDAAISSVPGAEGKNTVIDFSGRVGIEDMFEWTQRPELKFSKGETTVLGNIIIPGEGSSMPLEVNVSSPLVGVELKLPKPFYKPAKVPIKFNSKLRFFDDGEEYQFTFDKQLRLTVFNSREHVTSAKFEVNNFDPEVEGSLRLADTGVFNVAGRLNYFDLDVWIAAKDEYFAYVDQLNPLAEGEDEEDPLLVNVDVLLDKFVLGSLEIDGFKVKGDRQYPFWLLDVESQVMAGRIVVPEDERPIGLDLKYLRFEDPEVDDVAANKKSKKRKLKRGELEPSVLADIDLARAVDIDFSAEEFSLGEESYGAWQFKLRVIEGGVVVHDIHATTRGMQIGTEEQGAEFVWLQDESGHSSQFTGQVVAGNLADVFEAWGQEKLLESKSANIDIDAHWPGAPDQVTLKTVEGIIKLDIVKGSFNRGAGSDENALLRLLALFNFDTILRRLRLDFSDLASEGFSYDTIRGNLDFKNGKIYLTEPLIVESSSSYVQVVGTIDVVKEKLDTDMVVTLPLASSAAFATAIIVNLPAAIGLYVMSKLFKKQLDRVSSMNVGVKGKWEDPKVKVKKIFDMDAAQRRGEEIKEERAQESAEDFEDAEVEVLNENTDAEALNENASVDAELKTLPQKKVKQDQ